MVNFTEILIWGDDRKGLSNFVNIVSAAANACGVLFTRDLTSRTKAVIFLYSSDESFATVDQKSGEVFLPIFFVKIIGGDGENFDKRSMFTKAGERISHLALNPNSTQSIQDLLLSITDSLKKRYKILSFSLSRRGMRIVKWISFVFSLFSALLSILVIFLAGIISISRESTEQRWFANSLLTSGNLTFVMSFVGFYGVKKSGIKEYLKIYSGILVVNSLYKVVLITEYSFANWNSSFEQILIPGIVTSIVVEFITSCIIFLELNVVKKANIGN